MTRIVTTHYRCKPSPRERKKEERLWGLDQVFPLAGQATTIHEQCRLGFVSAARLSEGPYAVILKPPDCFERFPISEADFETLEQELRAASLKRAR
jgi:hypothetical protein